MFTTIKHAEIFNQEVLIAMVIVNIVPGQGAYSHARALGQVYIWRQTKQSTWLCLAMLSMTGTQGHKPWPSDRINFSWLYHKYKLKHI